jgi:signal transduction histidine kinase/DNA-binding response OmpR family regulator
MNKTSANPFVKTEPTRSPIVLIVDHHAPTATKLAEALQSGERPVRALTARTAQEALDHAHKSAVDVLITDYWLPGVNGLELIERLQRNGCAPGHTLLLAAQDVPGLDLVARRLKVNHYLVQPVAPERIRGLVMEALDGLRLPQAANAPARSFKILVADDRPDNVALLTARLGDEGYTFITASDGEEALQRLAETQPDLMLLDVNMPKKDGFQVLAEMGADPALAHIPVIVLTAARTEPRDIRTGLQLGADDYLTKPFDWRELAARVRAKLRVKQIEDELRRRNRELSLLPQIGRELSACLNIEDLAGVILKHTVPSAAATDGHLVIKQPDGGVFHKTYLPPVNDAGHWGAAQQRLVAEGLMAQVSASGESLLIEDTHAAPFWLQEPNAPTRSAAVVPLLGYGGVLGALLLYHTQPGYFQPDHLTLLQAIASQAAIAVENAQLFTLIEEEQRRSAAVLRAAADAILVLDPQERLCMLNPAGRQLLCEVEIQVGQPLPPGPGHDELRHLVREARLSGAPVQGEIGWPDRRSFNVLVTPIEDGGQVVVLQDVTHFKDLEQAKNEFVAAASHDLKNPISAILGYVTLLKKAGPLTPKQADYVAHIQEITRQMTELVKGLLELARIDMGVGLQKEALNLRDLLLPLAVEFQTQADLKQQAFELSLTEDRMPVRADAPRLRQVLHNLVGNALKYTGPGGHIRFEAAVKDDRVWVSVCDDGPGIPAEDLPFIFDKFYRAQTDATRAVEGNGLGLAIAKAIVEQHGGQICVESTVGQGACFRFSLPLMPAGGSSETARPMEPLPPIANLPPTLSSSLLEHSSPLI